MNSPSGKSEFQENLDLLRETYLFSGLPMESLKVFAYISARETFQPGDLVFQQGDEDGQAVIIVSGSAELVREEDGREYVVDRFGENDFLGGLGLLGKIRRLFSLKATTDLSCLILTREKFNTTVAQFPDLIPRITNVIIQRIVVWEDQNVIAAEGGDICLRRMGVSAV